MLTGKMNIQTLQVAGFDPAFHGMRNPKQSWDKSDSKIHHDNILLIGEKDMELAQKLILAGREHGKFMRMIQVWADVTMPRYWWVDADTYKFGVKNGTGSADSIIRKAFTFEDFYLGKKIHPTTLDILTDTIEQMNWLRSRYLETEDFDYIREIKRILPESFLQLRTWNTNYEELRNIYFQRKTHKFYEEWRDTFNAWVGTLPYAGQLILLDKSCKK